MKKHFVNFLSPGTFVHEETSLPIDKWDVEKAQDMARGIKERYDAIPFAFYFTTRGRGKDDLDSKEVAHSNRYYLGGKIETIQEVRARKLKDEEILLRNMESNGWDKIIVNTNSWKVTQPLDNKDIVLDWKK